MTMVVRVLNPLLGLVLVVFVAAACGNRPESELPRQPTVVRKKIAVPQKGNPHPVKSNEQPANKPEPAQVSTKTGKEAPLPSKKTEARVSETKVETKPSLGQAKTEELPDKKPSTKPDVTSSDLLTELAAKTFTYSYDPKDKLDPFQPLFSTQVQRMAPGKKKGKKKRLPLTPLQRIDLTQLKLVGIVVSPGGNKALVEEPSGKGYIVSRGTYVGTNFGRVKKVLNDRVIIEEEVEDYISGEMKPQTRELRLQTRSGQV